MSNTVNQKPAPREPYSPLEIGRKFERTLRPIGTGKYVDTVLDIRLVTQEKAILSVIELNREETRMRGEVTVLPPRTALEVEGYLRAGADKTEIERITDLRQQKAIREYLITQIPGWKNAEIFFTAPTGGTGLADQPSRETWSPTRMSE